MKCWAIAALLAGCVIDDVNLEGKACPCASGWVCDSIRNVCVRSLLDIDANPGDGPLPDLPCSNGIKDGDETDVDCGGACLACPSAACAADADCVTGACKLPAGVCVLASGPPNWLAVAGMHNARFGLAAALGKDGRIYAIAGLNTTNLNVVEAYTPFPTDSWDDTIPSAMVRRRGLAAATGVDGTIYAFGGKDGTNTIAFSTTEAYEPTTRMWSAAPNMLTARFAPGGVRGPDERIYAIGGSGLTTPTLASVERFDPATQAWGAIEPLNTPRHSLAAVMGPDNLIYAIGGLYMENPVALVEAYSPPNNTIGWTARAAMPTARYALAAAVGRDGRIYAIGGGVGSFSTSTGTPTVEAYSPADDRWDAAANLPVSPGYLAAATGADGCIYVMGGLNGSLFGADNLYAVYAYCPRISLSRTSARVGDVVSLSGSNFAASTTVNVYLGSAAGRVGAQTTNAAGQLIAPITFTVPAADPGPHLVTAIDERSRYPMTVTLTVVN
jgi:hypothetical protein